ncbi:MAG: hypothetical protein ACEY3L_05675 [Wolbachia sp.]
MTVVRPVPSPVIPVPRHWDPENLPSKCTIRTRSQCLGTGMTKKGALGSFFWDSSVSYLHLQTAMFVQM